MSIQNNPQISNKALELINELNIRGIEYCHWKSNEHLIEGLNGLTDLDLLVNKEHKEYFYEVLSRLHFKKVVSQPYLIFPGMEDWMGYCETTGILLHLHVHFDLITGMKYVKEYNLPWTKYVLASVNKEPLTGMYITNPNVEIILLLLRIGIKTKRLTLLKLFIKGAEVPYSKDTDKELQYLKNNIDNQELDEAINNMFEKNSKLALKLREIINKGTLNIKDILNIKKHVSKELNFYKKYNSLQTHIKYLCGKAQINYGRLKFLLGMDVIRKKRIESGGIIVAIIGSDGSGKTTMASDTTKWLHWKIDTHKFYLGSGDGTNSLLLKFVQLFSRLKSSKENKIYPVSSVQGTGSNNSSQAITLKNVLKTNLFLHIAKQKRKNIKSALKLKNSGSVIIFDRYPQAQFLGLNDSPNIRAHVLKKNSNIIFEKAARKEESIYQEIVKYEPDVVIKLLVTPEEAIRRKPDHGYEQIEKKVQLISNLTFRKSKVYEVDTSITIDEVKLKIRRIIWENL